MPELSRKLSHWLYSHRRLEEVTIPHIYYTSLRVREWASKLLTVFLADIESVLKDHTQFRKGEYCWSLGQLEQLPPKE